MRILVTGGAGFNGPHYVRSLLSGAYGGRCGGADVEVVVLDKLTYAGSLDNLAPVAENPRLTFMRGDILDPPLVDRLTRDADALVHFAAETSVDRSIFEAADFVMTNVVGTRTLLGAPLASRLKRFVHVSTDEAPA